MVVATSGKTVCTVADALCNIARERGVTEARMVDHTMEGKMKVGYKTYSMVLVCLISNSQVDGQGSQQPMAYRYNLRPSQSVNAFKPKALTQENLDASDNLRVALFGALWDGRYSALRASANAAILWEAGWGKQCFNNQKKCNSFQINPIPPTPILLRFALEMKFLQF